MYGQEFQGSLCLFRGQRVETTKAVRSSKTEFVKVEGRRRIVAMELCDSDAIDLIEPGFVEIHPDDTGSSRFIAVEGWMDIRKVDHAGLPGIEFSWEGNDEGHAATGRRWATLSGDGSLNGRIFFHMGDDSSFTAVRAAAD